MHEGGASELVASIHKEVERWRRRFAEGEPMFVRGDITQPRQLWQRLIAGKGAMAEMLRDGFQTWLGADESEVASQATGDQIEDILIGYFNEIMTGTDLLRILSSRIGLDCEWGDQGLKFVPLRSTFDYPEDPEEPSTFTSEAEDRRQVDLAIARAIDAWKAQGFPSAEVAPSTLEFVVGFPLCNATQSTLSAKCAPELLPFRNRHLINEAFPVEVSRDLIRNVVPVIFVRTSATEGREVDRIEAIGANGIAIHLKGGRAHVGFPRLLIQHFSQTVVHLNFTRQPAPSPEMGFHTGIRAR